LPAEITTDVALAPLTTLHLGGAATRVARADTETDLVDTVRSADGAGEPVLLLAGGSNVVIADHGFPGTVVAVGTRGVERALSDEGSVLLRIQAGEPWDDLVSSTVADGLAGIECLAGIPGSVGATPIQNVGAYGQDVSETITTVTVLDRRTGAVAHLPARACGFRYRSSAFKGTDTHVVLAVTFELRRAKDSGPVCYPELARELGVAPGASAPATEVRAAVLRLRRAKGMVIDPTDPDSVSAGSFFTNPILSAVEFTALQTRVAGGEVPHFTEQGGLVKVPAAWLIEKAGFARGDGQGAVGISTKHTLALINRGGATTAELLAFARSVAARVRDVFGVTLSPEPVLVGVRW